MPPAEWIPLPGHIIRASVPHTDDTGSSIRFPVVVSSKTYNKQYPDVVVAFTTRSSNIKYPRSYDVEIPDKRKDFNLTGLRESTTVRCGRLHTISKKKIYDQIGCVPDDLLTDIQRLVILNFQDETKQRK
jgi:mRNA-degrading endonuclease toxin of MazEF toxin-antitoxin module